MAAMTGARRGAPAARVAAVLVLTVLVGGCGSAGDQVVEEAAQRAGEAAGVQDVQVDREAGSITVDTEQGTVTTDVSGELPDGFPAEQVPLVDGPLSLATGLTSPDGRQAWSVTVDAEGGADTVFADGRSRLERAGYDLEADTSFGSQAEGGTLQASDGSWQVLLSVVGGEGGAQASYTVLEAE